MRNSMFTNTTSIVETKAAKDKDMLDILLSLSDTERRAVMKTIKEGNKMVNNLEVTYDRDASPKMKSTMLFMC